MAVLFLVSLLFTAPSYAGRGGAFGDPDDCPAPMLLSPTTENIDLSGKDFLEFKWLRYENPTSLDHYEFSLYKGYATDESSLMVKQNFSYGDYPIKVPVSSFEVGQTYTWFLKLVFWTGIKSDRAFSSFKIIKK